MPCHIAFCTQTHAHKGPARWPGAVGVPHAIGFVIMSSVVLVLLFYFIRDVILVVIGMYCIAATSAMTTIFAPVIEKLSPRLSAQVTITHGLCLIAAVPLGYLYTLFLFLFLFWQP